MYLRSVRTSPSAPPRLAACLTHAAGDDAGRRCAAALTANASAADDDPVLDWACWALAPPSAAVAVAVWLPGNSSRSVPPVCAELARQHAAAPPRPLDWLRDGRAAASAARQWAANATHDATGAASVEPSAGSASGASGASGPPAAAALSSARRSARRRLALHRREEHALLRRHFYGEAEVGEGAGGGAGAAAELSASACAALASGEMAQLSENLAADIGESIRESGRAEGIMSILIAPIMMMMMPGAKGGSSQKSTAPVGGTVVDIVVIILTVPITLALATALSQPLGNIIANVVGESLVIALTSSLIASVKLNAGYVVVQNLIVIICEYLQNEFASVMAFLMATFLAGVLPTALTDAVTTGVTNLLLPKLTTALTGPVMGYHYCVYCYYYGDFCQSCFWNNDLTWMDRDWWLSPQQETYT